mgnify:CR=1 FL=1
MPLFNPPNIVDKKSLFTPPTKKSSPLTVTNKPLSSSQQITTVQNYPNQANAFDTKVNVINKPTSAYSRVVPDMKTVNYQKPKTFLGISAEGLSQTKNLYKDAITPIPKQFGNELLKGLDTLLRTERATTELAVAPIAYGLSKITPGEKPSFSQLAEQQYSEAKNLIKGDRKWGESVEEAGKQYVKNKNIKSINDVNLEDIAVLSSLAFFNLMGDPITRGGILAKELKEAATFKKVGEIKKVFPEGVTLKNPRIVEIPLYKEGGKDIIKIKIDPSSNQLTVKGFVRRGWTPAETATNEKSLVNILSQNTGTPVESLRLGADLILRPTAITLARASQAGFAKLPFVGDKKLFNPPADSKTISDALKAREARLKGEGWVAPVKDFPAETPAISKELQPLAEEARKYKSAEEFVSSKISKDYVAEVKQTTGGDIAKVGTYGEAGSAKTSARRKLAGDITAKEIDIAKRDQTIFDANKNKTVEQLQKEITDSKNFADQNNSSYSRSIKVKEDIIKTKSQLTDIWNKAQQSAEPLATSKEFNKLPEENKLSPEEKTIQNTISKKDFENIVERFFPLVKSFYEDEGIKNYRDYLDKVDQRSIELELDSYESSNNAIRKLLGDAEIYIGDVVDAYKSGILRDEISREPYKIKLDKISDQPVEGKSLFYEPQKINTDIKNIYQKAIQKMTDKNKADVLKARKDLYLNWATQKGVAKEIGISETELNKKIRSMSGATVNGIRIQQQINEGVPEQYQWTGISNSNFLIKNNIKLSDVDKVVNKIENKTARYSGGTENLSHYIMNTFLGIDTKLRYDDLNFKIWSLEKALGQYSNKDITITISSESQNTVAHEVGHYLDYRFARELGIDNTALSGGNINYEYLKEKYNLSDEQISWSKEFVRFTDNLVKKSEIGSSANRAEYLQKPTEVFARFTAEFVDWVSTNSGYNYSEMNYYDDKFDTSDYYNFIKLLQKKGEIDTKYKIQPIIKKGIGSVNKSEKPFPKIKTGKEQLAEREAAKVARQQAQEKKSALFFPDSEMENQYQNFKKLKVKNAEDADQLKAQNKNVEPNEIDNLLYSQDNTNDEVLAVFQERYAKEREKLPEVPKETKAIFAAKKIEKIKTAKDILDNRRSLVKAVQKQFGLSDKDIQSITRRDIRLMDNFTFKNFLDDLRVKAEKLAERRQAVNELMAQIKEKELNFENVRRAFKQKRVENMTIDEIRELDKAIEPYQTGDEFLPARRLEVLDKTEMAGLKTWREIKEYFAKELDVPLDKITGFRVNEFDRAKWDTVLAEKHPVFKYIVEKLAASRYVREAEYLDIEKQTYNLAKKLKTTLGEKLIPQQKKIMQYLESDWRGKKEIAEQMTTEEIELAEYMRDNLWQVYQELITASTLKSSRFADKYITHIRRGFLEGLKDSGFKTAIKEVFAKNKMDEVGFKILDNETGEILAFEKFFKYQLKRTGEVIPTQNAVKSFLTYMKTYKKKQALDNVVVVLDTLAQAVTPKGTTKTGLALHGDMMKFMKEWLNTKKGRHIKLIAQQGGLIERGLNALKTFVSIKDLGANIGIGLVSQLGEQVTNFQMLGHKKTLKGKIRVHTKKGKEIIDRYRNFVGKNPWSELIEPAKELKDRFLESSFVLFRDASVRANKEFLLGSLTDAEWESGIVSPERLAEMRTELGRYRVIEDAKSIIGSTPEAGQYTMYKTWAIPILNSNLQNLKDAVYTPAKAKIKGENYSKEKAKKAWVEGLRAAEIIGVVST